MENLENIKIENTNLLSKDSITIHNIIELYKINNVKQLIDMFENNIISIAKTQKEYKYELNGLINLIKFKYLDITLNTDNYLNTALQCKNYISGIYIEWPDNALSSMGFNKKECQKLDSFAKTIYKNGLTIHDVFTEYLKNNNINNDYVLSEKILLHLKSYKYKKETPLKDKIERNKQIEELIRERDSLYLEKYKIELRLEEIEKEINILDQTNKNVI